MTVGSVVLDISRDETTSEQRTAALATTKPQHYAPRAVGYNNMLFVVHPRGSRFVQVFSSSKTIR